MASAGQFRNRVKVIAVANIGAAFKKSQIVARIIKSAQAKGHVATGKLTNPASSRSINGKYQNLSSAFSEKKAWMPPVNAIANWIRAKQGRGQFQDVKEKNIRRVAFGIALKIKNRGIKQTSFANHFFNKTNGVQATLNKGMKNTTRRLDVLYATSVDKSIAKMIRI